MHIQWKPPYVRYAVMILSYKNNENVDLRIFISAFYQLFTKEDSVAPVFQLELSYQFWKLVLEFMTLTGSLSNHIWYHIYNITYMISHIWYHIYNITYHDSHKDLSAISHFIIHINLAWSFTQISNTLATDKCLYCCQGRPPSVP